MELSRNERRVLRECDVTFRLYCMLEKVQQFGLTAKMAKCQWAMTECSYSTLDMDWWWTSQARDEQSGMRQSLPSTAD